ncbi:MAG: sugar ABC transporter permease [Lachnospiraceae bacterium]|nr:sugar ABC transporter permease [Lachnospiraceae bacterium]MBP5601021.1 sugar ABC transporter permease [Lachnospiraceae bacterium]
MLLTMVAPTALWLILLRYIPMAGIVIAFKKYKVYTPKPSLVNNIVNSKWVGLGNFKFLFTSSDTLLVLRNTVGYNLLWIALGVVISVSFAIMINEITSKFVAKTYQTMMFFPFFLSWVVVSYFVMALLDPTSGLIVKAQLARGLTPTEWYHDYKPWPVILTICNLWKNMGYQTILYLAAITGIDKSQYEAAAIDGASKWQQIWYVTIPNLRNMVIILLIMDIGKIFNSDFGLFYSVPQNSGTIFRTTQVLDTYVYRALMNSQNIGMSTAASLFQNAVGFVLIMITNTMIRKIDPDSALF